MSNFELSASSVVNNIRIKIIVSGPCEYDGYDDCFTTNFDIVYTDTNNKKNYYTMGWVDFYRTHFHYDIHCNEIWDDTGYEVDENPEWYGNIDEHPFFKDVLNIVHLHIKSVYFENEATLT